MLCIVLTLNSKVFASANVIGDWEYVVSEGKVKITKYTGNSHDISILSVLGGYPVVAIGEDAFNNKNILFVNIPEGVTSIGARAFKGCTQLIRIHIPDSVTYIANDAFHYSGSGDIPSAPIFYCTEGSVAHKYAVDNNFRFYFGTPTKEQFTFNLTDKTYNAKEQGVSVTPKEGVSSAVIVKYNGSTKKPKNAGSYKVTVDVGLSLKYSPAEGIDLGTFTINKADISKVKVVDASYTGKKVKPTKFTYNGVALSIASNAKIEGYGTNKKIGKGTIRLTGTGNFKGTKTLAFKINPTKNKISKINGTDKQISIRWTKVSSVQKITKYEVRYRQIGKTTWKTKIYNASSSSATIKELAQSKYYDVQVRSYKMVGGVKYYSAWSELKAAGAGVFPSKAGLKKGMTTAQYNVAYVEAKAVVKKVSKVKDMNERMSALMNELSKIRHSQTYSDNQEHYNNVYGFFVQKTGVSCAGGTRAVGLCLTIMGYPYEHVNESQWTHQWARAKINEKWYVFDADISYFGEESAPYRHPYYSHK